ncbi:hypothetical protein GQ43DRAFT_192438 [Delitschia confertaspora ATCC 74209]|uniref:Uncharacterized protein n=1 Tax=Delitschia confertaspora ATCC 74209 TaxID=1513339 RepID=A0A9P4JW04_9PLEO|nr:hypothetical protein GQ43DRAFT_192438 [Delitschia confertaspora ATCC 74209]
MADRLRGFPKPQLGCLTTQPNAQSVYNPLFYPLLPRNPLSERIQRNSNIENKKRKATNHANCSSDLPDVYRQYFPSIYPAIPNTFHRHIQLGLPNPLISPGEAEPCHPRLAYLSGQSNNEENHKQLEVDGFVKAGFDPIFARNMVYSGRSRFDFHTEDQHIFFYQAPTQLPPEFGGVAFGDDHIGREMWEF